MVRVTTPLRFAELGDCGIPLGWQAHEIAARYRWLGGQSTLFDQPFEWKGRRLHERHAYTAALERIAIGVRANDAVCIELAVKYFELNAAFLSHSGYTRVRLARALRHVSLTDRQCLRNNQHLLSFPAARCYSNNFGGSIRLLTHTIDQRAFMELKRIIVGRHAHRFVSPEHAWEAAKDYRWIRDVETAAIAKLATKKCRHR